ncbi:hypothetical protein AO888_03110 [Pseudomonas aeruginosa]|nr:hypothetical protein AO888_03110 [Pseudomonas aeruginosa]
MDVLTLSQIRKHLIIGLILNSCKHSDFKCIDYVVQVLECDELCKVLNHGQSLGLVLMVRIGAQQFGQLTMLHSVDGNTSTVVNCLEGISIYEFIFISGHNLVEPSFIGDYKVSCVFPKGECSWNNAAFAVVTDLVVRK